MSAVLPSQVLTALAPLNAESATPVQQSGFSQVLTQVNQVLANADTAAAGYAQGKVGLTEAVLASEKADITFQILIAVRNRALAAYQEIMNLQV
jgi:flagellar hook-basal body complex protein FliE